MKSLSNIMSVLVFLGFLACSSESHQKSNLATWDIYEVTQGDYPNNDIGSLVAIYDTATCKNHCNQLSGCVGFVFSPISKTCIFKSKMEFFQPSLEWQSFKQKHSSPISFKEYPNLDFPGNDLEMITNASVDSCKSLCAIKPNCAGFVYNNHKQYCHLKSNFSSPGRSSPEWNTFAKSEILIPVPPPIDDSTSYRLNENADYGGNDLEVLNPATVSSCSQRCDNRSDCVGFVFHKSQKYCHLKSKMEGFGAANFAWNAFFKPTNTVPEPQCVAIQVLAGENIAELSWRKDQLVQSGYDAYISQKPGTNIHRLRVRSTNSNAQAVANQLALQFGYTYWITSCD